MANTLLNIFKYASVIVLTLGPSAIIAAVVYRGLSIVPRTSKDNK